MREIKFRAWVFGWRSVVDPKLMGKDTERTWHMRYRLSDLPIEHDSWDDPYCELNKSIKSYENLMQYTGLKDKNGKEIYEGDILRYRKYRNMGYSDKFNMDLVEWRETGDSDGWAHSKHYEWMVGGNTLAETADGDDFGEFGHCECEIIGNKYENPELLNKD